MAEGDVLTIPASGNAEFAAPAVSVGDVQVVTRTLSSAEILTLSSAPTELVAVAAGEYVWPISAIFVYNFDSDVFTDPGNIVYLSPSGVPIGLKCDNFQGLITSGVSRLQILGQTDPATLLLGIADGAALTIWGDFGDLSGSGQGTLDVTVLYRVVTLT